MTTMVPKGFPRPVRVLVRGTEAACAAYQELAWASPRRPLGPAAQGGGWWSIVAEPLLPPPGVVEAVLAAPAGLMAYAEDETAYRVLLSEGMGTSRDLLITRPDDPAEGIVAKFVTSHRPRGVLAPGKRRSGRRAPPVDEVDDEMAAFLADRGWPLHQGLSDARTLSRFGGEVTLNQVIGETPVPWSATRWMGGITNEQTLAIWDRENLPDPVHEWPSRGERPGRDMVEEFLYDYVARPILESTRLPGPRAWTHCSPRWPNEATSDSRLLVHWHPVGHMGVHATGYPSSPSTPPARRINSSMSRPGFQSVSGDAARWLGLDVHADAWSTDVPLTAFEQVKAVAASETIAGQYFRPWQDVPDDVPRGLEATMAWVRAQPL